MSKGKKKNIPKMKNTPYQLRLTKRDEMIKQYDIDGKLPTLTANQEKFVETFVETRSVEKAYLAGYNVAPTTSKNSIRTTAWTVRNHPAVAVHIHHYNKIFEESIRVSAEDLVKELLEVIQNSKDEGNIVINPKSGEVHRNTDRNAIIKATQTLSKMLGLDKAEKVEVTVKQEQPLFTPIIENVEAIEVKDKKDKK